MRGSVLVFLLGLDQIFSTVNIKNTVARGNAGKVELFVSSKYEIQTILLTSIWYLFIGNEVNFSVLFVANTNCAARSIKAGMIIFLFFNSIYIVPKLAELRTSKI